MPQLSMALPAPQLPLERLPGSPARAYCSALVHSNRRLLTRSHSSGRHCTELVAGAGLLQRVWGPHRPRLVARSLQQRPWRRRPKNSPCGLHGHEAWRATQAHSNGGWKGRRMAKLTCQAAGVEAGSWTDSESDDESTPLEGEGGDGAGEISMAKALNVSPQVVSVTMWGIFLAALVVPLLGLTQGFGPIIGGICVDSVKTRGLAYLTLLLGFYMAWNIGANDVANAMGTSVGSGALTLRQAIMVAAVLEFAGAFLVGSHVTHTMQKGIVDATAFAGQPTTLFCGMLASLASAGTWLQMASFYGWPVSTTHSIIGAMVGFGIVYGGWGAVYWPSLGRVVSSWIISPLLGALCSFAVYKSIRMFVYSAAYPGRAAARAAPLAVFFGVSVLVLMSTTGPMGLGVALRAVGLGAVGAVAINTLIRRNLGELLDRIYRKAVDRPQYRSRPNKVTGGPKGTQLKIVYQVFGYLQVLSACFMSFAHGANDVANAIGPISAALAILHSAAIGQAGVVGDVGITTGVLAWGGFGIVAGLVVWGYRVIATIGKKITELTPTRGFAAEFAAASVVVLASRLGLPVSATHTLVGAVVGVGFARGLNSIRGETIRSIILSWVVTIPLGALLAIVYTAVLRRVLPVL